MKSVKKQGIERFNEKEFDKMNELVGGAAGPGLFRTSTSKFSTKEGWFDKDSQNECLCEDVLR
jgi:hypothetical protein